MIHTRLLIAACVAALLGAAPLIAQDMQQPGMNNQGGQSDQIYKKKKKMGQTQGQTQGQMTGTEQTQNQATGQEMQPLKKKKLQQSTQGEQTYGQGQNQRKLKKQQMLLATRSKNQPGNVRAEPSF